MAATEPVIPDDPLVLRVRELEAEVQRWKKIARARRKRIERLEGRANGADE